MKRIVSLILILVLALTLLPVFTVQADTASAWMRITTIEELNDWKDFCDVENRVLQLVVAARSDPTDPLKYNLLRANAFPAIPTGRLANGTYQVTVVESGGDLYLGTDTTTATGFINYAWIMDEVEVRPSQKESGIWNFSACSPANKRIHSMGFVALDQNGAPNTGGVNLTNRVERGDFDWSLEEYTTSKILGVDLTEPHDGFQIHNVLHDSVHFASLITPPLVSRRALSFRSNTVAWSANDPNVGAFCYNVPNTQNINADGSGSIQPFNFVMNLFVNTNPPSKPVLDTGEWIRINDLAQLKDGAQIVLAARCNAQPNVFTVMNSGVTMGRLVPTNFTAVIDQQYLKLPLSIVRDIEDYRWTLKEVGTNTYTLTNDLNNRLGWVPATDPWDQATYFSSDELDPKWTDPDWTFSEHIGLVQNFTNVHGEERNVAEGITAPRGLWHCGWKLMYNHPEGKSDNRLIKFSSANNTKISSKWRFGNYVATGDAYTDVVDIFMRVEKPALATDLTSPPHNLPIHIENLGAAAKLNGTAIRFSATLNLTELKKLLQNDGDTLEFGWYTLRMQPLTPSGATYMNADFVGSNRYQYRLNKNFCTQNGKPIEWKAAYNAMDAAALKAALYGSGAYDTENAATGLRIFDAQGNTLTFALSATGMAGWQDLEVCFMPFVIVNGVEYKGVMKYNCIADVLETFHNPLAAKFSRYMSFPY
ncbi:MAG: hypothetical protein FWE69_04735 [Clostridiales bacterium]|nr:hypothetical protein [Clostridiales bacterium]